MEETSEGDTTEIDDLKYRISQLEHLVITQSLNNSSSFQFNSSNNNGTSSCCCNNSVVNQGIIERSSQLESLLAASEIDNSRLNDKIALLKAEKNREHVEYLEILKTKDKEIEDLHYTQQLLQGQSDKYKRRFENVKEYINTLPSNEELKEAKKLIEKLETANGFLTDKTTRIESKILSLQKELFTKESQYQDVLARLDELKHLEKAQENYLKDDKLLEKMNVSNKKELSDFLTVQRAQLERSKEIINSYREKLHKLNEDKSQYMTKIYSQSLLIKNSQEQLVTFNVEIEKLSEKVDTLEHEKIELVSKCEKLLGLVSENEQFMKIRDEQLGNIIKLVMEIDLCVFEMGKSITLGQKICSGEEPKAEELVGLSDFDFHADILCAKDNPEDNNDDNDEEEEDSGRFSPSNYESTKENEDDKSEFLTLSSSTFESSTTNPHRRHRSHRSLHHRNVYGEKHKDVDIDSEWVLKRWEKVRHLRKDLAGLRSQLNQFYIQRLSDSVEGCQVQ